MIQSNLTQSNFFINPSSNNSLVNPRWYNRNSQRRLFYEKLAVTAEPVSHWSSSSCTWLDKVELLFFVCLSVTSVAAAANWRQRRRRHFNVGASAGVGATIKWIAFIKFALLLNKHRIWTLLSRDFSFQPPSLLLWWLFYELTCK